MYSDYSDADAEEEDLRSEFLWEWQQKRRLARNPDCRDPAHPGCEFCADRDDETEEQ